MSWSVSASGSYDEVLQAVQNLSIPPSSDTPPADPKAGQQPDPQLVQGNAVKELLINELNRNRNAKAYSLTASGHAPNGYLSISLTISSS